jgi:transposase
MTDIMEEARQEVVYAMQQGRKGSEVAALYGIPLQCVYACMTEGYQMGTLLARKVLRVKIARVQAEQRGEMLRIVRAQDRYKGTRGR